MKKRAKREPVRSVEVKAVAGGGDTHSTGGGDMDNGGNPGIGG